MMMVTQGGTGSGTSGPCVRKIWEYLYGIKGENVQPEEGRDPRHHAAGGLPAFATDGSILPPAREG